MSQFILVGYAGAGRGLGLSGQRHLGDGATEKQKELVLSYKKNKSFVFVTHNSEVITFSLWRRSRHICRSNSTMWSWLNRNYKQRQQISSGVATPQAICLMQAIECWELFYFFYTCSGTRGGGPRSGRSTSGSASSGAAGGDYRAPSRWVALEALDTLAGVAALFVDTFLQAAADVAIAFTLVDI